MHMICEYTLSQKNDITQPTNDNFSNHCPIRIIFVRY